MKGMENQQPNGGNPVNTNTSPDIQAALLKVAAIRRGLSQKVAQPSAAPLRPARSSSPLRAPQTPPVRSHHEPDDDGNELVPDPKNPGEKIMKKFL